MELQQPFGRRFFDAAGKMAAFGALGGFAAVIAGSKAFAYGQCDYPGQDSLLPGAICYHPGFSQDLREGR